MSEELEFNQELEQAFKAYWEIKNTEPEDFDNWFDRFLNAMYELYVALGKANVYALANVEFYDNVAQINFRRGRPVDLGDLLLRRKAAIVPGYLCTHYDDYDENEIVLGVNENDVRDHLKSLNLKTDYKQINLPFDILYKAGIEGAKEDFSFLLLSGEKTFRFGMDQCRTIASGNIDRISFISFMKDAYAGKFEGDTKILGYPDFKGPSGDA